MKLALVVLLAVAAMLLPAASSQAASVLFVDDDLVCGGLSPCYAHPQDAVNAASPGDTILVFPGVYGSRRFTMTPPHYGPSDQYAPALIVYKDGLTIRALSRDPAETVIEATHSWWSNPVAIQASTGGTWNGSAYVGAGVNPVASTAPNAISIIASNVTIEGFMIRRPYNYAAGGHNSVLIGGLYVGYGLREGERIGFSRNVVRNCVFGDGRVQVRNGVTIWHSSRNVVADNWVIDPHWSAFMVYDGSNDAEVRLQPSSRRNFIVRNKVVDNPATWSIGQCVFVGAWNDQGPTFAWTNNIGTDFYNNDCGGMGIFTAYSYGRKRFAFNENVGWEDQQNASDALFYSNQVLGTPSKDYSQFGPP